jgi:hypothetical protein
MAEQPVVGSTAAASVVSTAVVAVAASTVAAADIAKLHSSEQTQPADSTNCQPVFFCRLIATTIAAILSAASG